MGGEATELFLLKNWLPSSSAAKVLCSSIITSCEIAVAFLWTKKRMELYQDMPVYILYLIKISWVYQSIIKPFKYHLICFWGKYLTFYLLYED
jgi:hypothetical protein